MQLSERHSVVSNQKRNKCFHREQKKKFLRNKRIRECDTTRIRQQKKKKREGTLFSKVRFREPVWFRSCPWRLRISAQSLAVLADDPSGPSLGPNGEERTDREKKRRARSGKPKRARCAVKRVEVLISK